MSATPDVAVLDRIARAVLANAGAGREAVDPFVAVVDRISAIPWASLAVPAPGTGAGTDWAAALPRLEAHFAARDPLFRCRPGELSQLRSRMRLGSIRCLLARLDGTPAGAGSEEAGCAYRRLGFQPLGAFQCSHGR